VRTNLEIVACRFMWILQSCDCIISEVGEFDEVYLAEELLTLSAVEEFLPV